MNIYTFPVTCDVCGGEGVGTIRTAAAAWERYSTITHVDPSVCRAVLEAKERDKKRKAAADIQHEYDYALDRWFEALMNDDKEEAERWSNAAFRVATKETV